MSRFLVRILPIRRGLLRRLEEPGVHLPLALHLLRFPEAFDQPRSRHPRNLPAVLRLEESYIYIYIYISQCSFKGRL